MKELKLSPPWYTFLKEVEILFQDDKDVNVVSDFSTNPYQIKLYVNGEDKADALTQILPDTKEFGNITVNITVIPADKGLSNADLFRRAFSGNPAFSYVKEVDGDYSFNATYVVFRNKVIQYFADNLADVNGNITCLYETIARDVFKSDVYFCTDSEKNLGAPLGEWP